MEVGGPFGRCKRFVIGSATGHAAGQLGYRGDIRLVLVAPNLTLTNGRTRDVRTKCLHRIAPVKQ